MLSKSKPGVYMILNLLNNKRYVGSSSQKIYSRLSAHKRALKEGIHFNQHLQKAWDKYGEVSFSFTVLENTLPVDALAAEQKWIDAFRGQGLDLYNIRDEATSNIGLKWSGEQKEKFLQTLSSRSQEARAILSAKLSKLHKGRKNPWTVELRAKDWPSLVDPDGNVHQIKNLHQFCQEQGLNTPAMRHVALGERKTYKGWRLFLEGQVPTPYSGKLKEYGANHTLTSPDGLIYENVTDLEKFAKEHGLDSSVLRKVCIGKYRHHRGWAGIREGYTPKTNNDSVAQSNRREWPSFLDPEGNPHQTDNLYQFCKQNNLDKGAMQRLVKGQAHTHKGWRLA